VFYALGARARRSTREKSPRDVDRPSVVLRAMELVRTRVPGVGFEEGRGRGRACAMHEKTRTLGHRWPALGNPACSRRWPQSEAWNRVPHVPHSFASSGLPRCRLPPHLWHVPFAASFPTMSAEVMASFSHTATAAGDVMPRVFGTRTGPRDARLRATIAGFPFSRNALSVKCRQRAYLI
jgi:hypothetical protein